MFSCFSEFMSDNEINFEKIKGHITSSLKLGKQFEHTVRKVSR